MTEPLQWETLGKALCALDGAVRYRITMTKANDKWYYVAHMNGAKIGGQYKTVEEAIAYVEFGGDPPRRSKEQNE